MIYDFEFEPWYESNTPGSGAVAYLKTDIKCVKYFKKLFFFFFYKDFRYKANAQV